MPENYERDLLKNFSGVMHLAKYMTRSAMF